MLAEARSGRRQEVPGLTWDNMVTARMGDLVGNRQRLTIFLAFYLSPYTTLVRDDVLPTERMLSYPQRVLRLRLAAGITFRGGRTLAVALVPT